MPDPRTSPRKDLHSNSPEPVHVVRVSPRLVVRTRDVDVQEVAPDFSEESAVGDLERPAVPVRRLAGCDFVRFALRGVEIYSEENSRVMRRWDGLE